MAKFVAICACPMGLAHTFMAADSLKKAAEELGVEIKIETQGADGIKNELTKKTLKKLMLLYMQLLSHLKVLKDLMMLMFMKYH